MGVTAAKRLLAEIARAVEGLYHVSESDHPWVPLRWEGVAEITPEFLREASGLGAGAAVEARDFDQFFGLAAGEFGSEGAGEVAAAGQYGRLARLMKERLTGLRVYRVGEINLTVYAVGQSESGDWFGVSTRAVET